jgi:hypothetical protein
MSNAAQVVASLNFYLRAAWLKSQLEHWLFKLGPLLIFLSLSKEMPGFIP